MELTKRQFLKMGVGGGAAVFLGSLFRPSFLSASPVIVVHNYLDSAVHNCWMKLSYNNRRESRQVRRTIGVALRNLGAIKGGGDGREFALYFDWAVESAFRRRAASTKPASLFALIQMLYDDYLYPQAGVAGGTMLYGTLFYVLRGRDGTPRGETAYQNYLSYRSATLEYKDISRTSKDPQDILKARRNRSARLQAWQKELMELTNVYARREAALSRSFNIETKMLEGFDVYVPPQDASPSRLKIAPRRGQVLVSWKGEAKLQQAPTVSGPWSDSRKSSPALLDARANKEFFRTVFQTPKPSP